MTATAVKAVPTGGTTELAGLDSYARRSDVSLSAPAMAVSSKDEFACLGRKLLQPPQGLTAIEDTASSVGKSLPAAPAAILLGLVGFLCVTGVKDRKQWLTAIAAMIWLSHAGISALPNFMSHYKPQKHIKLSSCLEKGEAHLFESSSRLRLEVEGCEYISLLHQLSSIPDDNSGAIDNVDTAQPAIVIEQDMLNLHIVHAAVIAERFNCFMPAFIFSNQSRGPPVFA